VRGIRRHAWNTGQSALRTGRASSPSRARRAWWFLCCASSSSTRGSSRVHRRRCPSPWWTISLSKSACPRPPGRSMTGTVGPSSGTARRFGNTWASAKPPSPMARHWSPGSVRSSCPPRAAQIISRRRWRSGAVPSVSHRRPRSAWTASYGRRSIARTRAWGPRYCTGCRRRRQGNCRPS